MIFLRATSQDKDLSLYKALLDLWSMACHSSADFVDGKSVDYGWRLYSCATYPLMEVRTKYINEITKHTIEQVSSDGFHTLLYREHTE